MTENHDARICYECWTNNKKDKSHYTVLEYVNCFQINVIVYTKKIQSKGKQHQEYLTIDILSKGKGREHLHRVENLHHLLISTNFIHRHYTTLHFVRICLMLGFRAEKPSRFRLARRNLLNAVAFVLQVWKCFMT